MSSKIGKFKKLRFYSWVCSDATKSVTPKFYFISMGLIHRTTIYPKTKKNANSNVLNEKILESDNIWRSYVDKRFFFFAGTTLPPPIDT